MNRFKYITVFILMLAMQMVLTKYCQIGACVLISMLPAMILCLPTTNSTIVNMLIAMLCGLCVDFLAEGIWGLNAVALLPVAFIQKTVISLVIGKDLVERGYPFSYAANGFFKISLSMLICVLVYTTIYMIMDGVGLNDWFFITRRVILSTVASMVFCLIAANILCPKPQR